MLMAPRYALAKRKAQALLAQAGIVSAPVRLEDVAAAIGAKIYYEPFEGEDLSGMAYRQDDGKPVIGVNSLHPPKRQRFTIAHELGHLVLHAKDGIHIDETLPMFRTGRSSLAIDDKEIEANQFAAELLMPAEWVQKDAEESHIDFEADDSAIAALAKKYDVSVQAMTIRLSAIGALQG